MSEWTTDDYERLGDYVRSARRQSNATSRDDFADAIGVSTRTLSDIEAGKLGKRREFSRDTLAAIEDYVGWYPGATRAILNGHVGGLYGDEPPTVGASVQDARTATEDGSREDTLLFQRPEGVALDVWKRAKERSIAYLEGQLDAAAEER